MLAFPGNHYKAKTGVRKATPKLNAYLNCGSKLPEYVALVLQNGGSQSPDR